MADDKTSITPLAPDALRQVVGGTLLQGSDRGDGLSGGDGRDYIAGGAGDDALSGEEGNDALAGDAGNDTLDGGNGADILSGGAGDDTLVGREGDDEIAGGAGQDFLVGSGGDDVFRWRPGDGNDQIVGEEGRDTLVLEDLQMTYLEVRGGMDLQATAARWQPFASGTTNGEFSTGIFHLTGEGTGGIRIGDEIIYFWGIERIELAGTTWQNGFRNMPGRELDSGIGGQDTLVRGAEEDHLAGGRGSDELVGGGGDDILVGELGFDRLRGGTGDDTLVGGVGNDLLTGGEGADVVAGDEGGDVVFWHPGEGNDTIDGGEGTDTLQLEDTGLTLEQVLAGLQPGEGSALPRIQTAMPLMEGEMINLSGFHGTLTIGQEVLELRNLEHLILRGYTYQPGR